MGAAGKDDISPGLAVTFRPPMRLRMLWLLAPMVVLGGSALVIAWYVGLAGPMLVVVAAAAACGGLALGMRSFAAGITYGADEITLRNAWRTIRVPSDRLCRFVWDSAPVSDQGGPEPGQGAPIPRPQGGLWMEYLGGADATTSVAVDAFNRLTNPMAPLADGYRAWIALEELRQSRGHGAPGCEPPPDS